MKKLDEQIYLTSKNEKVSDISICQTGKNLFEVKSPKIDTRWTSYDRKTLNKLHKGLIAVEKAKCIVRGSIADAMTLAYSLRATL